jgi:hypothetical protein
VCVHRGDCMRVYVSVCVCIVFLKKTFFLAANTISRLLSSSASSPIDRPPLSTRRPSLAMAGAARPSETCYDVGDHVFNPLSITPHI